MTTTMNLFGSVVPNMNTTFLLDTSGSMYSCLATVREHLCAYLRVHAVDTPNPHQTILFNLIEFHSDIRQWADRCVFWSHASVLVADDWLRSLVPKTGTNTLGGLLTTFADPLCQQVVLVTDGIPDQEPQLIINALQQYQKRPCHIFYINTPTTGDDEQETVVKFLQDLASITRGSLTIAHFSRTGSLQSLAPMVNYQIEDASQPLLLTGEAQTPIQTTISTEVGSLLLGQECLARKDKDGYYYRGKILSQLNIEEFMIEFGPRASGAFSESDFQATKVFDIIQHTDSLMHAIRAGDFVLAPDGQQGRFVPGEVLDGFEKRSSCETGEIRPLVIHFASGKTLTLKRLQEAVWIPHALYERIKFELSLPPSARQFLQTHSVAYPTKLLPGYPMPTPVPLAANPWPFLASHQHQTTASPVVLIQQTVPSSVNSYEVNNLIVQSQQRPQSLITSNELNRKVDQQIQQHWFLLGERQPPPPPPPPNVPTPPVHSQTHHHHHHPHHHPHHHSHSTNSSPTASMTRKKTVCFNDSSNVRRYSVDDLDICRESTPLKSCLKSSTSSNTDDRQSPLEVAHSIHTQTIRTTNEKKQPQTTVTSANPYHSTSVPSSVEHWHSRQLKSAPAATASRPAIPTGSRRQNMGHLYETAQQEVKEELLQQQIQREQHKRNQAREQTQHIENRQQQDVGKSERIIDAKRQFREKQVHRDHLRTQAIEEQINDRLRFKQNQYAQRSFDRVQTRRGDEHKTAELTHLRQRDEAARNRVRHDDVLAQDADRLYKNVLARKFHEQASLKATATRKREEKQVDLIRDVENRRIAWSNSSIFS